MKVESRLLAKMRFIFNCVFFLTIVVINSNSQAVQRSAFGQFCNETVKCDKGAWLTCLESSCDCLLDSMIYDTSKSKCVSKSGERCKFQLSDLTSDKVGLSLYENTDCVPHGNCGNGFTCSCDPGYYETVDGLCLEQKSFHAPCSSTVECQQSKLLHCIDGNCSCSSADDHIWGISFDETRTTEQCVGKAGKRLRGITECIEETALKQGFCACVPEQYNFASQNGRCYSKKGVNVACANDDECQYFGIFLTCVNGNCGCNPAQFVFQTFSKSKSIIKEKETSVKSHTNRRPFTNDANAYYEASSDKVVHGKWVRKNGFNYGTILELVTEIVTTELSQCVGLTNKLCNSDSNCVKDSTCTKSFCSCDAGFSPTSGGSCGIGHGRTCSNATPCSDSFRCTNGICNCPQSHHQVYDSTLQKCIGLVSSYCHEDSDCVKNSNCTLNPISGRKQCACAQGYVTNSVGVCEKAWGSECEYGDDIACDSVARLQCRNGRCACADTLWQFNSTLRKCLGLVGSRCVYNVFTDVCVLGAVCRQDNPGIPGQCVCTGDYEVSDEMICGKKTAPDHIAALRLVEVATMQNDTDVRLTERITRMNETLARVNEIKAMLMEVADARIRNIEAKINNTKVRIRNIEDRIKNTEARMQETEATTVKTESMTTETGFDEGYPPASAEDEEANDLGYSFIDSLGYE